MNKIIEEDFDLIYTHTKPIWNELSNKTIFITGATGFFGKCLLQNFIIANKTLNLNIKVIALSRDPKKFISNHPQFIDSSIEYIEGDVKNFETPAQNIDYIIHAATDVNLNLITNEPLDIYDTIVKGTKNILELAQTKQTISVLFISSGAVYGKQPHALHYATEDFVGSPDVFQNDASYGEGKRVAEMLCNIYYKKHEVSTKIARCYSFVGSYLPLDGHFAIGNFIDDVINDKKITIQGDGSPFRAYLYTADLMIWLLNILTKGKPCHPYNVGSDDAINLEDLANLVNTFSKEKHGVEIMKPKSDAPAARYVPSIDRAKSELGLVVYTNLRDAISKTIQFYQ